MNGEKSKILIVFVILLVLVSGIIVVRRIKKPAEPAAEVAVYDQQEELPAEAETGAGMYLVTEQESFTLGDEIGVNVLFSAPGKSIFGSDVIILYDPEYLTTSAEKITAGDFFASTPLATVDTERGLIRISAYQGNSGLLSDSMQIIANVGFSSLKPGVTRIEIQFTPGATNTSTLVENGTSQNILTQAEGIVLTVSE